MNEKSINEIITQCEYIKNEKLTKQDDKQNLEYLIFFTKQVINLINKYKEKR